MKTISITATLIVIDSGNVIVFVNSDARTKPNTPVKVYNLRQKYGGKGKETVNLGPWIRRINRDKRHKRGGMRQKSV